MLFKPNHQSYTVSKCNKPRNYRINETLFGIQERRDEWQFLVMSDNLVILVILVIIHVEHTVYLVFELYWPFLKNLNNVSVFIRFWQAIYSSYTCVVYNYNLMYTTHVIFGIILIVEFIISLLSRPKLYSITRWGQSGLVSHPSSALNN